MTDPLKGRPAVRAVFLVGGGILLGRVLNLDFLWIGAVTAALLVVSTVTIRRWPAAGTVAFTMAVLGLGLFRERESSASWERISLPSAVVGSHATLRGQVIEGPRINEDRISFVMSIADPAAIKEVVGVPVERIRVTARKRSGDRLSVGSGDYVELPAVLEPPSRPRNPGDIDIGWYFRYHRIGAIAYASADSIRLIENTSTTSFQTQLLKTQRALQDIVSEHHGVESSRFLQGVLLGDRSQMDPGTREAFIRSGAAHVLAVSGLHVGIIAVSLYAFLGLLRIPRRLVVIGTISGIIIYMFLTGGSPSVVRATIMSTVVLIGYLVERRTDIYQSLGIAALILLLMDPEELGHPGFQLSFAAVLSIVFLYPRIRQLLARRMHGVWNISVFRPALSLASVTLAATVGTLPLTAFHFGSVSLVSLGTNLVVVPITGLIIPLGLATIVVSPVVPWIAETVALMNEMLIGLLLSIVTTTSSFSLAAIEFRSVSLMQVGALYCVLFAFLVFRGVRLIKVFLFGALVLVNVLLFRSIVVSAPAGLEIAMIDVGQGDAILLTTPGGRSVLVDAGPSSPSFDAGERIILPFLAHRGVDSLDLLVLTHPHLDHIGGALSLLKGLRVGGIVTTGVESRSGMYRSILDVAAEKGVPVVRVTAGEAIDIEAGMRCYVLSSSDSHFRGSNLNNCSVVLKMVYGSRSILLLGDVEDEVETAMAGRYGSFLKTDILKVAHHGSRTSSSPGFVELASPEIALISAGRRNRFGHPSPAVIQTLANGQTEVLRTDLEGAIVVRIDGNEVNRVHWRNGAQ